MTCDLRVPTYVLLLTLPHIYQQQQHIDERPNHSTLKDEIILYVNEKHYKASIKQVHVLPRTFQEIRNCRFSLSSQTIILSLSAKLCVLRLPSFQFLVYINWWLFLNSLA